MLYSYKNNNKMRKGVFYETQYSGKKHLQKQ